MAKDKDDKLALIVENANTKLIEIINEAVMLGYNKTYSKARVINLIDETTNELKKNEASDVLIESTKLALQKAFMKEWLQVIVILRENAKNDDLGLIGKQIQAMETNTPMDLKGDKGITIDIVDKEGKPVVGIAKAQINNLRDFVTDSRLGGTARYVDYKTLLQNSLLEVKNKLADGSLTLTDSLGRVKSVRNMAEIETRYKMINEDLNRQGITKGQFVIASSHQDASKRCSFWQGKIYLMDLDINSRPMGQYKGGAPNQTILGYIDGKPYYSLLQACENGFLSYNCQHRLIKYYKGASPIEYSNSSVKKARELTIKQRSMENTIRHWKRKERLSNDSIEVNRKDTPYIQDGKWFVNGVDTKIKASEHSLELKSISRVQTDTTTDKKYTVAMTNMWQDKYHNFSHKNNLPEYTWRTMITDYERK